MSTVLQGFYQSHLATAASVQVNNIHLLRGMLGRPGCGVLQMNGQPTAQNTRECGANGDVAGFRNWANEQHIQDLAKVWNVDPGHIPHSGPPTHVMKMLDEIQKGSIRMFYVSATNPAVSLPDLARVRRLLRRDELFLVVQDIFLTETAQLADVVLPAAAWGEKTGAFTNADRTVHLSEQAVDPPGEARSDLEIFADYARRLDLRDLDGNLLVPWTTPAEAFEAWKQCSAGRPCDYTGLSYEKLRGPSGIQWPCNDEHPDGTERLYGDGVAWAHPDVCETYGKNLVTGEPLDAATYQALNPEGRAILKAADYSPPPEAPSATYPYHLITGRTIYHFHTRTKTGRAPQLNDAAPEVWVEASAADAEREGWSEGDLLRIRTPRGEVEARLRVSGVREHVLFIPFHYGYWDTSGGDQPDGPGRAANELTATTWDPASKQPLFKTAAATAHRVG
jgi:anaerobic selenocysteine-containing dehydrogenase